MGCVCSRSSSWEQFDCVRVVHMRGFVEDFAAVVTVSQVIGNPSKHVVCSPAQLLTPGCPPMQPEDSLEPGQIYFVLPHSFFYSTEQSLLNLANVVNRLTAAARKAGPAKPVKVGSLLMNSGHPKEEEEKKKKKKKGMWKPMLSTVREFSFKLSMARESLSFGSKTMSISDVQVAPLE